MTDGGNVTCCNNSASSTAYAYSPSANTWRAIASLPVASADLAAVAGQDGKIYAFGGEDNATPENTLQIVDPTASGRLPAPTCPPGGLNQDTACSVDQQVTATISGLLNIDRQCPSIVFTQAQSGQSEHPTNSGGCAGASNASDGYVGVITTTDTFLGDTWNLDVQATDLVSAAHAGAACDQNCIPASDLTYNPGLTLGQAGGALPNGALTTPPSTVSFAYTPYPDSQPGVSPSDPTTILGSSGANAAVGSFTQGPGVSATDGTLDLSVPEYAPQGAHGGWITYTLLSTTGG